MKRLAAALAVLALWSAAVVLAQQPAVTLKSPVVVVDGKKYPTGARPSPRHKLASAPRHVARANIPAAFLVLPGKLDAWGNSDFGDCVSAEEAFKLASWSTQLGIAETFVDSATLVGWARSHGYLNGADLTSVMDDMIKDGIKATDGRTYHDGPYHSVDWTSYATLCSAIYTGPVKLGMAADQLQNVAGIGEKNGWFAAGFKHDGNEDHCTAVCGYGTAQDLVGLFKQKGVDVTIPGGVPPTTPCVAYFTWGTVGIMDFASLVNTTGEAWLRMPPTAEQPAPSPGPQPAPTPPTPVPAVGQIVVDPSKLTITVPAGWTVNAAAGAAVSINASVTVSGTSAAVK